MGKVFQLCNSPVYVKFKLQKVPTVSGSEYNVNTLLTKESEKTIIHIFFSLFVSRKSAKKYH